MKIKIGTRGSELALVQADFVKNRLSEYYPDIEFETVVIKTAGDIVQDKPLDKIGLKGVFVSSIEKELLEGNIHIAVHSLKDMPVKLAEGLTLAKAWKREDPRDSIILRTAKSIEDLPSGAVIATGSRRREIQIKKIRPDINVVGIRGNIDTRVRKMNELKIDGIILAAAGLIRLGLSDMITQYFDIEDMIPAPAQGMLAIEYREDDKIIKNLLETFGDDDAGFAAAAERAFLAETDAGCSAPVGAYCCRKGSEYEMKTMFARHDGSCLHYAYAVGTDPHEIARCCANEIRGKSGRVIIAGAGPGDPGLITVKALDAVENADCIIYDRLISPRILDYAKQSAEKIYVGKSGGHHTMPQQDINALMVKKIMQYDNVVRLKGGDPYVFGRGGEEGIYLKERGVQFTVIPGVSSAIAAPAYAGIPVTHRDFASGFRVVTAHGKNNTIPDTDFSAMANSSDTCIFLMGLSNISYIAEGLISAGKSPDTPAAVISSAAMPEQKVCVSTLADISDKVKNMQPPAVVVVGEVVRLHDKLAFYENMPLYGRRYLICSPGNSRLCDMLLQLGADTVMLSTGSIVYRENAFTPDIFDSDWIIFTSRNAIDAFFYNMKKMNCDMRVLGNIRFAVIGDKTKSSLAEYSINADFVSEHQESGAFAEALSEIPDKRSDMVYLKGSEAGDEINKILSEKHNVRDIVVYDNAAEMPDNELINTIDKSDFDAVLFTCASALRYTLKYADLSGKKIVSIGEKTSAALRAAGITEYIQAENASYESMIEKLMN